MAETTAPILRVKLRVGEVFNQINDRGEIDNQRVKLFAVTSGSEENKEFSKWTPSATFDIYINNPNAYNKLANGHEYYVDFIPTPSEAS